MPESAHNTASSDTPEQRFQIAFAAHRRGAFDDAVAGYRRVLASAPGRLDAQVNLAAALQALGRIDEAITGYRRALTAGGESAAILSNLGGALRLADRLDEARSVLERAVALDPDSADARLNLGNVLRAAGAPEQALVQYEHAARIDPRSIAALSNQGLALKDLGRLDAALTCFRRASVMDPNSAEPLYNLGNALRLSGALDEADQTLRRAVALNPSHVRALCNLGVVSRERGAPEDAIQLFGRALERNPDCADAHWNRALAWLLAGDFAHGWPAYEWRWEATPVHQRHFDAPHWAGEDLRGKTILLWAEQGFGDSIQFIRFAADLQARGANVIVQVQRPLVRLLQTFGGADCIEGDDEPPPASDFHAPLMSLPGLLGHTEIAQTAPYVTVEGAPSHELSARIETPHPGQRIGIVWAGNPGHENDRNRSCALDHFAPLAERAGGRLFGLQKNLSAEPLRQVPWLTDLGPVLQDFADTAQAVARLDLVITVDTAIAHLAGAMGRPVWLLLPFAPDWRWMLARDDSPWYPTMRLFRQPAPGDWTSVFTEVAASLAA